MSGEVDSSARRLLWDLVSISSVSGEEHECAERMVKFFEDHDRRVWLDDAGNVRAPGETDVLLTSHIDTVAGSIPVRVEDGELWGRGSVDAKGSLSAMMVAAVTSDVSFVGVVGEEHDSGGARHLVEHGDQPSVLINGEPSGWDGLTIGYRGHLPGTYVSTSKSGHSSRPENNAIQDAIQWWTRVADLFEADEWMPVFEQVTAKPVGFIGGISDDGLSIETSLHAEFRVPPEMTIDEVRELVDGELREGTVQWREAIPPVMESPRTAPARAFRVAIRELDGTPRLLRKTGTSDMNIFSAAWTCPMVTYGPGDSSLDHTPDERLHLDEYDRSIAVLERVCERLKDRVGTDAA